MSRLSQRDPGLPRWGAGGWFSGPAVGRWCWVCLADSVLETPRVQDALAGRLAARSRNVKLVVPLLLLLLRWLGCKGDWLVRLQTV